MQRMTIFVRREEKMSLFDELAMDWLDVLGEAPNPQQVILFAHYANLLLEWNQKINLTSITDPDQIVIKHFFDSLSLLAVLDPIANKQLKLIDIGSGAGFPGIALAIMRPTWRVTLVESTGKKADFLNLVVNKLELKQVRVIRDRAETLGRHKQHRESYDVAVARAVAALPVLAEYCLPFVRVGGHWVAQKGPKVKDELTLSRNAFGQLGGKLRAVEAVTVPGMEDQTRHLIAVEKVKATPPAFPRRPGMPSKRPL